jgi:hypothetical protein
MLKLLLLQETHFADNGWKLAELKCGQVAFYAHDEYY